MTYDDPEDEVVAYVENALSAEARTAFESRLRESPALQRQVAAMQKVDHRLKQLFARPDLAHVDFDAARARAAAAALPAANWRRWAGIGGAAIAAAVLIILAIQLSSVTPIGRRVATVGELYDAQVKNGFVPDHVCKDDSDFIAYSKQAFGVPLLARSDANVQIVGWVYASSTLYNDLGVSGDARIILAKADGREVLLLLDPHQSTGPKLDPSAAGRLRVFDRRVGSVGIFEITPLDKPLASSKFSTAGG